MYALHVEDSQACIQIDGRQCTQCGVLNIGQGRAVAAGSKGRTEEASRSALVALARLIFSAHFGSFRLTMLLPTCAPRTALALCSARAPAVEAATREEHVCLHVHGLPWALDEQGVREAIDGILPAGAGPVRIRRRPSIRHAVVVAARG